MGTDTTTKAPDLAALKAEMHTVLAQAIAGGYSTPADAMAALFPHVSRYTTVRMAVEVDMLARLVIADDTRDDVVGMYRDRAAQLYRQAGL